MILRMICLALSGVAFYLGTYSWALLAFLATVGCSLLLVHVGGRGVSAWKVSTNPKIVYWAHSTTRDEKKFDAPIADCPHVTLHLRDGTHLDIDLAPADMRIFVAWLTEHNPSIRCGRYDDLDPTVETVIPTGGRAAVEAEGSTPVP